MLLASLATVRTYSHKRHERRWNQQTKEDDDIRSTKRTTAIDLSITTFQY